MSRRRRDALDALYVRSVLATLGGLLVAGPALLWLLDTGRGHAWSGDALAVCGAIAATGLLLVSIAILASDRSAARWADTCSTHEAIVVPMLLAWPLYRLLKASERGRRRTRT
ncbi:hypothetical protein [Luteimonas sp. FCS-9]|uniref:hypothetical protein n=1 Tax=Luteimonas sp. FCS-9 TaxID=1547516 RepID=UPI00069A4F32|nr:hypothetical protein [Luteimonas sp. FCS-9]